MAWSWSQHPVYDNAFSLNDNSFTIYNVNGCYFSKEGVNISKNFKYFEISPGAENLVLYFEFWPLLNREVPSGVTISNMQNMRDYCHNGVSNLIAYGQYGIANGNHYGFHPSIAVGSEGFRASDFPGYNIKTAPSRIGFAINNRMVYMYHIFSASDIRIVYFTFSKKWANINRPYKLAVCAPDRSVTGTSASATLHLSRSEWISNNTFDELKIVYPIEDELLKKY